MQINVGDIFILSRIPEEVIYGTVVSITPSHRFAYKYNANIRWSDSDIDSDFDYDINDVIKYATNGGWKKVTEKELFTYILKHNARMEY